MVKKTYQQPELCIFTTNVETIIAESPVKIVADPTKPPVDDDSPNYAKSSSLWGDWDE